MNWSFSRNHQTYLILYFEPLETIAKGYRDYCTKMRAKLDNVSSFITELKTFQQQRPGFREKSTQGTPPELFKTGQLVYLLAPISSFHYKPVQRNVAQILLDLWS